MGDKGIVGHPHVHDLYHRVACGHPRPVFATPAQDGAVQHGRAHFAPRQDGIQLPLALSLVQPGRAFQPPLLVEFADSLRRQPWLQLPLLTCPPRRAASSNTPLWTKAALRLCPPSPRHCPGGTVATRGPRTG